MGSLLNDRTKGKQDHVGPITARLRVGLKVPTKAAQQAADANPAIKRVFQDVNEGRLSTRQAEAKLLELSNGSMKYPFSPRNTPFFNISATDFSSPELGFRGVEKLMELFGEERDGIPGRHLFRIPVSFADVTDVEKIYPSKFVVAQGKIKYFSKYDGEDRFCMYLKPVEAGQAKRKHLNRTPISRGACDPEMCGEFAAGQCKFNGTMYFHIPGFPGIAPFAMTTTSTYASADIYDQLSKVLDNLGRLPRMKPDGSPVFWLVKSQKQRTYFDDQGNQKTGLQWVPDLIADLDFTKLLDLADKHLQLGNQSGKAPPAWLASSAQLATQNFGVAVVGESYDAQHQARSQGQQAADDVLDQSHKGDAQQQGANAAESQNGPAQFDLLAESNGLTVTAQKWAIVCFGENWRADSQANSTPFTTLSRLIKGGGVDLARAVLNLRMTIHTNGVDDKLAKDFIKCRFGDKYFQKLETVQKAQAVLIDLLESGLDVAQTYMRAEVLKATEVA